MLAGWNFENQATSKEKDTGYAAELHQYEEEVPPGGECLQYRTMWAEMREYIDISSIVPSSMSQYVTDRIKLRKKKCMFPDLTQIYCSTALKIWMNFTISTSPTCSDVAVT